MASSRNSKEGDHIAASVDASVAVGGRTAIPKGADASLRVAGLADGLVLDLASLTIGGRQYPASSEPYIAQTTGKDKKGNRVLRHIDPFKKHGSDQAVSVIAPGSSLTITLKQPLEVMAP